MKPSIKDRAMIAASLPLAVPAPSPSQLPETPKTGPGSLMAFMSRESNVMKENVSLKAELAGLEGGTRTQQLDPKLVKPSKWANRDEGSFKGLAWEAFKEEIRSAGGNIQPIKVRGAIRDSTLPHSYEIIFGHRRHRACLELGLSVFALIEDATDKELFEQMDRENRQRADLTIYEQGEMYRRALDDGLYSSVRKLAESLGVGSGNASEAITIARLPIDVLNAFESRMDLQRRWAGQLSLALQKDPDAVLVMAKTIQVERGQGRAVKSAEVFKRLTTIGATTAAPVTHAVKLSNGATMQITTGTGKLKIELDSVDTQTAKRIERAIIDAMKDGAH